MFTARHYEAIADTLKDAHRELTDSNFAERGQTNLIASDLAWMFTNDNPRFDIERFLMASGSTDVGTVLDEHKALRDTIKLAGIRRVIHAYRD